MVEYSATFSIAIPADLSKASGVLFYEVPNRGRARLPAATASAGAMADLFKYGHIVLTSGWQGDLVPAPNVETISVPVARNADGSRSPARCWCASPTCPRTRIRWRCAAVSLPRRRRLR